MAKTVSLYEESYSDYINKILKPSKRPKFTVLDLFAGCGGLSLGFESVGFKSIGIEMDESCCETYNKNLQGKCVSDIITLKTDFPQADVIIGGPPCQPFSVSGKQLGVADKRNGIPAFIKAVEKIKPRIWMFENVRGILFRNKEYFEKSLKQFKNLGYKVDYEILNCVDYGVPQNRERVIVIGHDGTFEYPNKQNIKKSAGEALGKMAYEVPTDSKFLTSSMDRYVEVYERKSKLINPRDLHLDRPARALTCRNLAGATADMHRIKLKDGRRRRLRVQEAARLQSFPDWFNFKGKETSMFNQIGNAVPPIFARTLGLQIKKYLNR
jgi:DNA (cytosine-5)-methyltransferase 1